MGGGNCFEPHKKLWQCPPDLKVEWIYDICRNPNAITSFEFFVFMCFFNSLYILGCICGSSVEDRLGGEEKE